MAEKTAEQLAEELALREQYIQSVESLTEAQQKEFKNQKKLLANQEALIKAASELTAKGVTLDIAYQNRLKTIKSDIVLTGDLYDVQEQMIEALEEVTRKQEELEEQNEKTTDSLFSFIGMTEDAVKSQKKMAQQMKNTGTELKGMLTTMEGAKKGAAAGFAMLGNMAAEGLAMVVDKEKEAHQWAMNMNARVVELTDTNDNFRKAIFNTSAEMERLGITTEEFIDAGASLQSNITNLNTMSEEQIGIMVGQVALGKELGVAIDDTANSMQYFQRVQGMTVTESKDAAASMIDFGRAMGDPKAVMADFVRLTPQLGKFGNKANTVFKELEMRARAAGMEVEEILSVTDQFDTFEGAAEATGKLNAMLGGDFVSAMDMMEATNPAERFDMLRGSLDQAGMSFDSMGYYQRQAVAESMGLSDVNQLALMMSGNYDMMGDSVAKTQKQIVEEQKTQEEAAARARDVQEAQVQVMEEVRDALLEALAPGEDFAGALEGGAERGLWFADAMTDAAEKTNWFIYAALGMQAIQVAPTLWAGVKALGGWIKKTKLGTFTSGLFSGAMTAVQGTSKRTLIIIGLLALAMGLLAWYMLTKSNSPPLYIGLFIVAAGIWAIGKMSKKSVKNVTKLIPAMLSMALVVASVGIAIYIASAGIALMADSFAQLSPGQIIGVVVALAVMGVVLVALIGAIAGLGPVGWIAVAVMLAAATALWIAAHAINILAQAVALLVNDALIPLVDFIVDSVITIIETVIGWIEMLASKLIELATVIGDTVIGIINALVEGIRAVGEVIMGVMEQLPPLVSSLAELGLAGPGLILAGVGLGSIALGLGGIGLALQTISTADLQALGNMLMGLGMMSTGSLPDFVGSIEDLADLADDLDGELEFDIDIDVNYDAMDAVVSLIETINELQTATVNSLSDGIAQIARAIEEIPDEKIIKFQSLLDDAVILSNPMSSTSGLHRLIEGFTGGGGGGGGAGGGGGFGKKTIKAEITVMLDKKVVGKAVKDIVVDAMS